jgi:hypothetical protein
LWGKDIDDPSGELVHHDQDPMSPEADSQQNGSTLQGGSVNTKPRDPDRPSACFRRYWQIGAQAGQPKNGSINCLKSYAPENAVIDSDGPAATLCGQWRAGGVRSVAGGNLPQLREDVRRGVGWDGRTAAASDHRRRTTEWVLLAVLLAPAVFTVLATPEARKRA